ncbi:hypothetical protein BKA64DRAFT_775854 [Cadophora sp. MPI-SDFR-AT-0126]|nr:hypothetical protein BKA64DRAFT_775854 [Leotiomycetes sp. MPI-SDFR-AT-0126]
MSSHRQHQHGSDSGPLINPGRGSGHARTQGLEGPLAGGPMITLADRTRARAGRSGLASVTLHDNSNTQPTGSILPSANFRDDTNLASYTKPKDVKMIEKQPRYPNMTANTGSGLGGSILHNAAFRNNTITPGQPAVPNFPRPPGTLRGGYYGGRTMPKGWTPDMADMADGTPRRPLAEGEVDPDWYHAPPDFKQACISPVRRVMPPAAVNDPNYRGNYRTITSDYDKAMAEKELRFDTLSPAEQAIQKKWAKAHLKRTEVCIEGFSWWSYKTDERAPDGAKLEGYRCWAGGHMVTHEILVEDKGRYYTPGIDEDWNDKWGGPIWPGLVNLFQGVIANEHGEPKWKTDPNWRFCIWTKPGERPIKKKKWWKR